MSSAETDAADFKTISEVSKQLDIPQHVLRFWEGEFSQIKLVKRRGGRRFYNAKDIEIIERIKVLLYNKGYTIKGARLALNQNFIPIDDTDMKKKDKRQIDIFEAIEKPNYNERAVLQKILGGLKELQVLVEAAKSEASHTQDRIYCLSDE